MSFSEQARADRLLHLLNMSRINLQELLEPGYEAIAIHSNSTIIGLNQAAADLFMQQLDDLIGLNAWTLFPPESASKLAENILKDSKAPYQVTAYRKDGSMFEVIIKGIPFELNDEPVRAILLKEA